MYGNEKTRMKLTYTPILYPPSSSTFSYSRISTLQPRVRGSARARAFKIPNSQVTWRRAAAALHWQVLSLSFSLSFSLSPTTRRNFSLFACTRALEFFVRSAARKVMKCASAREREREREREYGETQSNMDREECNLICN